jgi:predicted RNase H-like nuclease
MVGRQGSDQPCDGRGTDERWASAGRQTAAWHAETGLSVDEYLLRYDEKRRLLEGVALPRGYPQTVAATFDLLARREVGARRSSVFLTPVRAAIQADAHRAAVSISQQLTGSGISIQAFSLRSKLNDVDAWARAGTHRAVEVHPEVSFARLAGGHLADSKATWAGVEHRRQLLVGEGIAIPADLDEAGRKARVDDILDAAVVAWSARRVARNAAISLPDPPETFSDGLPCAIWV